MDNHKYCSSHPASRQLWHNPILIMKLASFVLASILAQTQSQQIPVQFTDSVTALEYGSSSEFTCSWNFSATDDVNLNDRAAFTVSWSQGVTKIVSIKSDGTLRPAFSERWSKSYTASINVETSTSTFSINSAQLADSGDFSCHVELDDMIKRNSDKEEGVVQGQVVKSVSIYNNPDVSLESAGQIDIRSFQMNGNQEEQTIGTCIIDNAFPEPSKITAFINGEEVATTSDIVSNLQDNDLYSASWDIITTVDGKQMHGQNFSCSVADNEGNWEENDARFELDILYLPTKDDVIVLFNNGADVYENSNVTVSCKKGGNPELEPVLQFLSDGDEFIADVKRDNINEYACTLQDTEYALNITSKAASVNVFYLDDPVLSSTSGGSSINLGSDNSETLTCTVEANPPATYTWTRDGVPIDATSSTFKVNGNEDSHEGSYKCEVSIPTMVKQSEKIDIDIQEKCKIKTVKPTVKPKGDVDETVFTCLLENENTEPKCEFKWEMSTDVELQNPKKSGNTITFEDVVFIDTSNLECKVKNEAMEKWISRTVPHKDLAQLSADQGMSTLVQVVIGIIILLVLVAGCFVYRKKKASKEPQAEALQGQSV